MSASGSGGDSRTAMLRGLSANVAERDPNSRPPISLMSTLSAGMFTIEIVGGGRLPGRSSSLGDSTASDGMKSVEVTAMRCGRRIRAPSAETSEDGRSNDSRLFGASDTRLAMAAGRPSSVTGLPDHLDGIPLAAAS